MPSIPLYALSSKGENVSELGSSFTYRFKTPLQIPSGIECTMSLNQTSLWYVQPNISAALGNNRLVVGYSTIENGNGGQFTLEFEDGLYRLSALQAALKNKLYALNNMGLGVLTGDEITLVADNAQRKIVFSVKPTEATGDISLYFTNSTMAGFLGFNSNVDEEIDYEDGGIGGNVTVEDTAKFNAELSYFILNCSLSDGSYDSGGNFNGSRVARMFPININPGSQLVHIPVNPVQCSTNCNGQTLSSCTFSITNQHGTLQDMRGEEFSALVV